MRGPQASVDQAQKAERFRALHQQPGAFVIPNPWDAGTCRMLTSLGFQALTTTSGGLALALGRRDGEAAVTRDETLANVRSIVEATHLPVAADLENGFGHQPEVVAETIRLVAEAGAVGGSIEDATGDPRQPIYDFSTRSSAWPPPSRRRAPCRFRSSWSAGPRTFASAWAIWTEPSGGCRRSPAPASTCCSPRA